MKKIILSLCIAAISLSLSLVYGDFDRITDSAVYSSCRDKNNCERNGNYNIEKSLNVTIIIPEYKNGQSNLIPEESETEEIESELKESISKEDIEREKEFDFNFVNGVIAYSSGNNNNAMEYFEKCLLLKPGNEYAVFYFERTVKELSSQIKGF